MRADLYIREEDRHQVAGNGPVRLGMPKGLKCGIAGRGNSTTRTRELASGKVVCMSCALGPCQVPAGIGRDREIVIHKSGN